MACKDRKKGLQVGRGNAEGEFLINIIVWLVQRHCVLHSPGAGHIQEFYGGGGGGVQRHSSSKSGGPTTYSGQSSPKGGGGGGGGRSRPPGTTPAPRPPDLPLSCKHTILYTDDTAMTVQKSENVVPKFFISATGGQSLWHFSKS